MAKYLCRSCPRCNGYLGILLREPGRNVPLQAVNVRCVSCSYRLAWILIRGARGPYLQLAMRMASLTQRLLAFSVIIVAPIRTR